MASLGEQLLQLDDLHRRGALSDDEFRRAKERVLSQPPGSGPNAAALNGLRRSRTDRWLGGVCAGLAQMSGVVAWAWRLGFVLLLMCAGTGVLVYLLLWLLVPLEDDPVAGSRSQAHAS